MAIASMVCGIVGLLTFLFSGIRLRNLLNIKDQVGILFQWQINEQITTATVFLILSIAMIILAFIFGKIERKKGKTFKYYKMATAGFVLGLIGILLPIIPIIMVTGSVITYNVINKGGKTKVATVEPSSPYIGKQPEYAYYTLIGTITAKTKDTDNYSVTVDMILGYDLNDSEAQTELTNRQYELRDFTYRFFSEKYAAELSPENETRLKNEIREILNTRFLDKAKIRSILFNKLDVIEAN
jgi:flagellar FliL protein